MKLLVTLWLFEIGELGEIQMVNLLNNTENRRLRFVELLAQQNEWLILTDIASKLDCSTRVLKDDIRFLNDHYNDFTIETSIHGVRIIFKENTGLKSFCQALLKHSKAYQLLETLFLNENCTLNKLSETVYISSSAIYRMINQLNPILKKDYGFYIETNPCRIVGSEEKIRYFFYRYFFERYPYFNWPFSSINEEGIDSFLKKLLEIMKIPVDFAFFRVFKVITMVNLTRYENKNFIDIDESDTQIDLFMPDQEMHSDFYRYYEHILKQKIDTEFVMQVFTQYVQPGIYLTYEDFIEETKRDADYLEKVEYLRGLFDDLASANNIEFKNQETVVYGLFGTAAIEYKEPQSGYILYNRNTYFAKDIKSEFPNFYRQLYEAMKKFRAKLNKPLTEDGIHFYVYTVFSRWKNIVPELRRKLDKIKVLVISDRYTAHAEMIKDFIDYEFNEQIEAVFFDGIDFTPKVLEKLEYDLIISSFTLESVENIRNVYISNVPKYSDYVKIQKHIDEIILERISEGR